ncbi:MAG: hypothetical protein H7844_06000 [Nitrospirae bacterium YQR-1]
MREDVKIMGGGFFTAHPIFNPVYVLSFLSIVLTTFRAVPDFQMLKGSLSTPQALVVSEHSVSPDFRDRKSETGFGIRPPGGDGKFHAAAVTASSPDVLYIVKEGTGGGTVSAVGNTISWKGPVGKIGALKQGQKLSIMGTASSQSVIFSWNGCNTVTGSDCAAVFAPGKVITIKFEKVKK